MQLKLHMVTIEDLVPQEHFLRKLEASLDLSFVQEEAASLYSKRYGRPAIDPVVLVKYLLLGYLYGIPSERQIEVQCRERMPFRWYLGLDIDSPIPDHSTISQNRRRRPSFRKLFRRLFEEVVRQCIASGLVSGHLIATDSTHVKACASRASEYLADVAEEPGVYWERLDTYEEEALEELREKTGKRRGKRTKQLKRDRRNPQKRKSRTDPEAGYYKRPGKPRGMYYLPHTALDTDHGIILDVVVTPGDSSDVAPYLDQVERIHRTLLPIQAATADAAYDMALVHHELGRTGIVFYVRPQNSGERNTALFGAADFAYDEAEDIFLCPTGKRLTFGAVSRTSSNVYRDYFARKQDCQNCPLKERCLNESRAHSSRKVQRSMFEPDVFHNLEQLETPAYLVALRKRQIWCEGTFAIQKWSHNLTRVLRRGREAAEDHCLLSATALNLKRMIRCLG